MGGRLGVDWVWIGCGLGVDWVWIGHICAKKWVPRMLEACSHLSREIGFLENVHSECNFFHFSVTTCHTGGGAGALKSHVTES